MHISLIQEYTEGWQKTFLSITNEQQSSRAGNKNSLFFSSSELFLPET